MKSRQTKKPRQDANGHSLVTGNKACTSSTATEIAAKNKLAAHRHANHHRHRSSSEFGSPNDFPRLAQYIRYENSTQPKGIRCTEPSEVGISMLEDIDAVQVELEALWTNVSVRIRTLKASQVIVNESAHSSSTSPASNSSVQSTRAKSAQSPLSSPGSPVVRRTLVPARRRPVGRPISVMKAAIISRRSKKKLRGDRSSTDSKTTAGSTKPARSGQNRTHSVSQDNGYAARQPAPGHFWDFVESYCRDLTFEDLEILDKTALEHSTAIDDIFDIPPLGKFFRPKDTENSSARLTREKVLDRSRDVCGPLTQRLVSALVDNRVHSYKKNGGITGEDTNDGLFINRPGLVTALGLDAANGVNTSCGVLSGEHTLESRLKKILTEQGFLLPESVGNSLMSMEEKDEILVDILRTQDSLRNLHKNNAEKLANLQSLAKREIMRSQVKVEMEKADKEVLEAYRLISASRSKKKPLTKRERDLAARALDHRKAALVKLQKPADPLPELEEESVE